MYLQKGVIIIGGHVQALSLTRSYGENNIPVYILDRLNCLAKYSKYCQKFFICPDFSSNAFTDFLIELAKIENIKDWVLIPTNDHAVINLSKNKSELDEYYKMLVPPFEIIDHIYDKVKLIEIAKQLNIPTPNTQCFSNNTIDLNNLEFPIITKGKYGLTFYHTLKKKAFISSSPIELKKNLEQIQSKYKLEDTFSQTVISSENNNKTISFTSYSENGEIKAFWMGAKLRQHPIAFGTATFAKSVHEADILDYASRLIKHFEYTGVCEIEFLKDPIDLKFKLIEINARTWLWVGLAKECGINYALYIYNYLNNLPNNFPQNYQLGVKWINRITDTLFSIKAILTGNLKIKEYFYTTDGKTIDALYQKGDKKPYFAYIMLLISFARKR
jgi:predicted ATP-grasp superfamily ATP-dependent carboligase